VARGPSTESKRAAAVLRANGGRRCIARGARAPTRVALGTRA
jgi:hypothetical protein